MEFKDIEEKIEEFRISFLGDKWVWRKGQKEAIIEIILIYFNKKYNTVILDAPVGSGKSSIAMCVSWILNQQNYNGYILASDISLQDQYEKDLYKFRISWGSVKGLDNYECVDNMEKVSMGSCKIRMKEAKSMHCYNECPYYSAREKASKSQTSVLNYAYWLTMMNELNPKLEIDKQLFPKRDFIICDEAHKILDIIQSTYSPKLSINTWEKIDRLSEFFENNKLGIFSEYSRSIKNNIKKIEKEESPEILIEILKSIVSDIDRFKDPIESLKAKIKGAYAKNTPAEWKKLLRISDWLLDLQIKLSEYISIISKTSITNLIKNPNIESTVFNCLEERYLMHKYFHEHTGFLMLMSATFSKPSEYIKGIALKDAKYIKLESQFNFEKSPIYFYNTKKMSFNHINANLPWLTSKIDEIILSHKGESGLIHSGSYKLSLDIFNGLSRETRNRVLIYNGSEEKRNYIEELKRNTGKILLGPSLLEGLDMKDSWSRFIIFAKTPYPNLADRLVKAKMNLNPSWYSWKTSINIIQGVGRGVRHSTDYCKIYYLDATLGDIIHKDRSLFPEEFLSRMIPISN